MWQSDGLCTCNKKKKGVFIMPKRILASLLAVMLLISIPVFAEMNFSDLSKDHWAYSVVEKLVNDGTVNGFTDNTFRPSGTVTRAQFVKMMGEGTVVREKDFSDLAADHWAYKYAMTSEMDVKSNKFEPDKAITREETIVLLYKRAGSPEENKAPVVIANQAKNKDAVAWAYNNGIMIGDDGVNLRLEGNLSRAEAAALIVRARETDFSIPNQNFVDVANEELLKRIFESFTIFDDERAYSANATVTVGELSKAALRIISDQTDIIYSNYSFDADFEHKYAKDVAIINKLALGETTVNKALADRAATRAEAVAILSAAFAKKAGTSYYGDVNNTFEDVKDISSKKKSLLAYAFNNGVLLNGDGTLGAGKKVTHKDLAALLIQYDEICGSQTAVTTTKQNGGYKLENVKLSHNLKNYPANHAQHIYIAEGVPAEVYEAAVSGASSFKNVTFVKNYRELFADHLTKITEGVKGKYGIDMELVIYPGLVYADDNGNITIKALTRIKGVPSSPVLTSSVFSDSDLLEEAAPFLKEGAEFFVKINTSYLLLLQ